MASPALVDVDVVLKAACYTLVDEALGALTIGGTPPAMLGVGRFVARSRIDRGSRTRDRVRAHDALHRLTSSMELLEPALEEVDLAASFETLATKANLDLDGGESQLLAILLTRGRPVLVTGDKRAILAIGAIVEDAADGRIACLEQLMAEIVKRHGGVATRPRVCAEPDTDRAISLCFGCAGDPGPDDDGLRAALSSYVEHLRGQSARAMLPGPDLDPLHA